LIRPTLDALKRLGGSATVDELDAAVTASLGLSDEQLQIPHISGTDTRTEIEYRLAWTRTILKIAGLIENSSRGVWALRDAHLEPSQIDPQQVLRRHRQEYQSRRSGPETVVGTPLADTAQPVEVPDLDWRERLLSVVRDIAPDQFERLSMRLLREAGFTQVVVTGRSGDGGIDGKGIVRLQGIVSFHVVFQCKRYTGVVQAQDVRAFRGAIEGRADRGLFITSGRFTSGATAEASREGARPIDLIDGGAFAEMLKHYGLGVTVTTVEQVDVDRDWYSRL
jgi:restriction system protein